MTAASSAVSSLVPTQYLRPPVLKDSRYDISTIVLEFLRTRSKDVVKGLGYVTFWMNFSIPGMPEGVNKFSIAMTEFKNVLSAVEIPEKLVKAHKEASNLFHRTVQYMNGSATGAAVAESSRQLFKDVSSVLNSVTDGVEFSMRYVKVEKAAFQWLKGINFFGTIVSSGMGFVEQANKVRHDIMSKTAWKDIDLTQLAYHTVSVITNASYIAVGAVGLWFVLAGVATIPWMIILPLSIGLTSMITNTFIEKIFDPEHKGKNHNPAVVVENANAQRNYLATPGRFVTSSAIAG